MLTKYAIIDIGSNTIRLVIYGYKKFEGYKEIQNIKVVARLRNYLDHEQNLHKTGITILTDTLKYFEDIINDYEVKNIKAVATAAIRKAKNKEEIIQNIQSHTNLHIRILSEYEEAYYGYLAVMNSTSITEGMTIDIGGGSTEVTYFKNRKLIDYHSFPFGVLSLKQQFIKGFVPTEAELIQLSNYIKEEINKMDWLKNKHVPLIGIGGSARNVAQLDQKRKYYPLGGLHQYEMNEKDLKLVKMHLEGLTFEQLKKMEGLSEDRADIIFPAIEVFRVFYHITKATSFILSRKGLRDGLFYEELLKPYGIHMFPNVIEESLFRLAHEYEIDSNHTIFVTQLAVDIIKQLAEKGYVSVTKQNIIELKRAAFLFQIGRYIDPEASSQHTFYLLANRTIDGVMHKERLRLAVIASYKSKTIFKQLAAPFMDWFSKEEWRKLRIMGAILRFSNALNVTKRHIIQHVEVKEDREQLIFSITCAHHWKAEKLEAMKQKRQLEKMLKQNILLQFKGM